MIALTGAAANVSGIAGGIVVFGDPLPGTAVGVVVQAIAFLLVIVAAALTPAPVRAAAGRRNRLIPRAPFVQRAAMPTCRCARLCACLRRGQYRCTIEAHAFDQRTRDGDDPASRPRRASGDAAGAGEAPPVDALHAHGRLRASAEVPIIVRGDGCYVWDEHGNRYLDGLSSLFCSNLGHGRADIAQAGADQATRARLLLDLVLRAPAGDRAGGEGRRRWRPATSTASSSRPAAARRSSRRSSSPAATTSSPATRTRRRSIAREIAYHGTTLGALSATGVTGAAHAVRAAHARRLPRAEHERLPPARRRRPDRSPRRCASASCSRARRPSPR